MKKWQIEYNLNPSAKSPKPGDILRILLKNRGITKKNDIDNFLNPSLSKITPDTVGINKSELRRAIERIEKAIISKEKIIIYGDYDVDGVCASAILWETLNKLGANVMPYIPSRFNEGYGLSKEGIDGISKSGKINLIITVDNGIVANDAVFYAKKRGIDVIVTDHHVQSEKLPKAYAIIHTVSLCGAGVAYILSKQILKEKISQKDQHLELVTLATIADLVPLINANRTLVYYGIKSLQNTKRPGILALIQKAGLKKDDIGVYEIGHIITPRLNAMGRLENAMDSLRLICTNDIKRADSLSMLLTDTNLQRQQMTFESLDHAKNKVNKAGLRNLIFIADKSYKEGIVGLIAGRMVEEFYRPSIVISKGKVYSKASARSVLGFNIIEFLRQAKDLLVDVGGHPMAAGFTVETSKLSLLEKRLSQISEKLINKSHLERILRIDLELDSKSINLEFFGALQKLAPFGMANPEPKFLTKDLTVESLRLVGNDGKHIKLKLSSKGNFFDCIAFGMGEQNGFKIGDIIDVVYSLDENIWNGNKNLQLKIKDIRRN